LCKRKFVVCPLVDEETLENIKSIKENHLGFCFLFETAAYIYNIYTDKEEDKEEERWLNGSALQCKSVVLSSNPAPPHHTANSVSPEVGSHLGCHSTVCWPLRGGRGTYTKKNLQIYRKKNKFRYMYRYVFTYIYISIYIYMLPFQYIYTENGTGGNRKRKFVFLVGKRYMVIDVCCVSKRAHL
jgi:hypothetical protein